MFGYVKLAMKIAGLASENAMLRVENARLAAHFDWLAAHVNELKIERAALLEKTIGLQIGAVPMIARTPIPTGPLLGADPRYEAAEPPKLDLGDLLAKARDVVDAQRRPVVPGLEEQGRGALSFEDMGDDQAKGLGILHAPDGSVAYTR